MQLIGKIFSILLILFILSPSFTHSQDLEIEGFIYEKTKTKVGRDFYEAFLRLWELPVETELEKVNITIEEQTDPRWGTQIFVYVENTLVYYTMLKPRLEDIDEKADEAVQSVFDYMVNKAMYLKYLEEEQKFL